MWNRQKKTQAIGRGEWHQTRWCKSQCQPVTGKKPRGDDEQCKAEPGQSDAVQSRDGAAWRHDGLGVTCKPNSDSRAGINSSEEQKVNHKAGRCHAERKQPGLLEMQLFELDRRLVTKKAELG